MIEDYNATCSYSYLIPFHSLSNFFLKIKYVRSLSPSWWASWWLVSSSSPSSSYPSTVVPAAAAHHAAPAPWISCYETTSHDEAAVVSGEVVLRSGIPRTRSKHLLSAKDPSVKYDECPSDREHSLFIEVGFTCATSLPDFFKNRIYIYHPKAK